MDSNRIVVVGRIGSSYGVKGWTHVRSYTEPIENLTDFPHLYGRRNEEPWSKLGNIEFRRHGDGLIAKIDGCDDRTEASTLSNLELGVQRDILPPLEEG